MALHLPVKDPGIYFITFTCFQWLPLIHKTDTYNSVYRIFNILNEKHSMLSYVILPNHVHFLLHYKDTTQSLNTIVGNGKRFIGYDIIKRLREDQDRSTLKILSMGVMKGEAKANKQHALWKDTFDVQQCFSNEMIDRAAYYIHQNPVKGKWKLADSFKDYVHSSAGFYYSGREGKVKVVDYRKVMLIFST